MKNTPLFRWILFGLLSFSATALGQVEISDRFITELRDFLAIPNDANDMDSMQDNLDWLVNAFHSRGFVSQDLSSDDYSLLFVERKASQPKSTILFYFHYDGQPIDASQWNQANPYQAVLKRRIDDQWTQVPWPNKEFNSEDRIFARSASDDKGPIVMLLHAIDQLDAIGQNATNIKIILDGKEERGSPGLANLISNHIELFSANYLIVIDGPQHQSNLPTITFGCRGSAHASITTFGPIRPEHSGHFGNIAPNPAFSLSQLLTTMKDDSGRVLIDDFYNTVDISQQEKRLIDKLPDTAETIKHRLQVAELEKVATSYYEALLYPSLNVRRLDAPLFSGLRTIVPDRAKAELDLRLVPETSGQRQLTLLKNHLESQGYLVLNREPTMTERMTVSKLVMMTGKPGIPAFQTNPDAPISKFIRAAIKKGLDIEPVEIPLMGGTVPITPVIEILGIPALIVPLTNSDNNQHSPNENLRLANAAQGIKLLQTILQE